MKHVARCLITMLFMLMLAAGAAAQEEALEMRGIEIGEMIDVGFASPSEYLAGCVFQNSEAFLFVHTDFNEGYLVYRDEEDCMESLCGGIPVPQGGTAKLTAKGRDHCVLRIKSGKEEFIYTFSLEPAQTDPNRWVLSQYEKSGGGQTLNAAFSPDRVHVKETTASGTREEVFFYAFYCEANNIDFARIPNSIEAAAALQRENPVAAVSPKNPKSRVNLRKGPSAKAERVGSVYSGARFRIRSLQDGWAEIWVGDTEAYISAEFLAFGAEIDAVADARPTATLIDREWVEISRVPYRGGGGSVWQAEGGQTVRILGEYNKQWRIVDAGGSSYYIHTDNLR